MYPYQDLIPAAPIQITDDKAVAFVHIPKTAGTTFKDILFGKFPIRKRVAWDFMSDPFPDFSHYQLYYGHFYYPVIKHLLNRPAIYLSFFRNPIERSISSFYQLRRTSIEEPHLLNLPDFPTHLETFLDSPYCTEIIDFQTRFLTTELTVSEFIKFQVAWGENSALIQDGHRLPAEAAYPIIDSLDFFGITEDFNTSMDLLSYTFGWEPIQTVESKNVGSYPQPAKHVIDKIIELNQEDLKLYDYAKHVFNERAGQMRRDQQRLYYLLSRARTTPRDHTLRYVFDHTSGQGWYNPENDGQGVDFVWTGPGTRSTLDLALAHGQDLILRCHVFAALQDDILAGLQISVNNHPITLTYHPSTTEKGLEVEGLIPSTAIPRNRYFSTVVFSVPYTMTPNELDINNPDTRALGVALAWLEVSPAGTTTAATAPVEMEASLSIDVKTTSAAPNSPYTVGVRAQNTGYVAWVAAEASNSSQPVKLGAYWVDSAGIVVKGSTTYRPLPSDVFPGSTSQLTLTTTTPPAPGEYTLCVNLLQSPSAWLEHWFTSNPAQLTVRVG